MRILHVIANVAPRYGGPAKACQEMAQAVATRGHEVHVATTNQDGQNQLDVPLSKPIEQNGVIFHYFPIGWPRFWGTSWPMQRYLRDHIASFNLVHIHSLYMFHSWVAGYYCRRYKVPYLIRPHGSLDPFLQKRHRWRKSIMEILFEDRNLKGASAIHFTTKEEQRLAAPFVFGQRGLIIPNALHWGDYAELPKRGEFRKQHPELADKFLILFFGRINFKKGLDILAKAFGQVAKKHPEARLIIAGPDDNGLGEKVRRWLAEEGVLDKTVFTGMVLGQAKRALLADSDLFVLPSYSENFGLAVVEAMAYGLPVIVSDQVNISGDISSAHAGEVVSLNPEEVSAAIIKMINNKSLRFTHGSNGRELVKSRFNWTAIGSEIERSYQTIVRI